MEYCFPITRTRVIEEIPFPTPGANEIWIMSSGNLDEGLLKPQMSGEGIDKKVD